MKDTRLGESARWSVLMGMQDVADIVGVTMGPRGRNVMYMGDGVVTTNDGVTVAKQIELEGYEELGARMIKDAAENTNREVGDGTTTTVVLAEAMCNHGLSRIDDGINPFELIDGMNRCKDEIIDRLSKKSSSIKGGDAIKQVASLSAQDDEVGEIIAEVFEEVGEDGTITVEAGGIGLAKEVKNGMQIDGGYISPYFITNPEKMEAVIEKPYIIIYDGKVESMRDLVPLLEKIVEVGNKNIVIIANDIGGDALPNLILNKMKGVFNIVAVKLPGYGDTRGVLEDIATVSGGKMVSVEAGDQISEITLDMLGMADNVIVSKDKTTIVGGKGLKSDIKARAKVLKEQAKKLKEREKNMVLKRVSKLVGGVAIIKVGAATETEMKNKRYKIEDALNATKAAIEEGVIVGGGTALYKIANDKTLTESLGRDIVTTALKYPIIKIIENSGNEVDGTLAQIIENSFNHGFNAKTEEYGDLVKMGVIDPVKVIRVALENAVSTAAMFLTTEAAIIDIKEEDLLD